LTNSRLRNVSAWNKWSDGYQEKHGWLLAGSNAEAWGLWRRLESEIGVLGTVDDRDVLEIGCGAAHWSIALARRGARATAVDPSTKQLAHARAAAKTASVQVQLLQGYAEALPVGSASFDIAFSDYGGLSWAPPAESIPEAARVLRPGGVLAFCTHSPLFFMFWDDQRQTLAQTPQRSYFDIATRRVEDAVDYQLPYGDWIALFAANGLTVERLLENRPLDNVSTTFKDRPLDASRTYPVENIWRLRKL
jgi:SAM-dependent methyltransferase